MSIISPPEYVGNIMPMCQDRRGVFKDMQYLDTNLVELHYSMPIGEIIYDFFDALKAKTRGYASLDYELEGYEKSDLVKVDLLLNGDQVDALSFIAHRDKAYPRARRRRRAERTHQRDRLQSVLPASQDRNLAVERRGSFPEERMQCVH